MPIEGYILWLINGAVLLILFLVGLLLYKKPPKRNFWFGYRTEQALKSENNFYVANKLTGKYFIQFTSFNVIINLVVFLICYFIPAIMPMTSLWLAMGFLMVMLVCLFVVVIKVENRLNEFDRKSEGDSHE